MFDQLLIHTFLDQPGTTILALVLVGWVLAGWGICRTNHLLLPGLLNSSLVSSTHGLDELKKSLVLAWPVYWLMLFFILVNRDLAWSAGLTLLPTLLVLPAALAGLRMGKIRHRLNVIPAAFLTLAVLVLFGSGMGLERTFSRLSGHFILTVFLLYLWWEWPARSIQPELPFFPAPKLWTGRMLFPVIVYQLGALILLLAAMMLKTRLGTPPGFTLGLFLALAWTPSLTKVLMSSEAGDGSLVISLPLAIIFLIGPLPLLFGSVDFPISLWQMEVCTGFVLTLLWLGLALINQPLAQLENVLLLALYLVYLALRILRLF